MPGEEPQLLNAQKAAAFLGIHPSTIRLWAKSGKLKAAKAGTRGDWRFRKEDLLKLTKSNQNNHLDKKPEARTKENIARPMQVKQPTKQKSSFRVVGIGASAGGFEAFSKLLQALPTDTGMAFVFVQHLAPTHSSALSELLSKETKMPVLEARNHMRIAPNTIYVIPPNADMTITDGSLKLTLRDKTDKLHHPIDAFLNSLASTHQSNAIGIILSGTATDGTLGLKAIKDAGGITMAQDKTAKYQGMPQNAINLGVVDFTLSPGGIAKELSRIAKYPHTRISTTEDALPKGDALKKILFLLQRHVGVDFTDYKQTTIKRRIMRRMILASFKNLEDYTKFLRENPSEIEALYQDLLISVTMFFRDDASFTALAQKVLPVILKKREPNDPVRIWVAGCATGEEAYSIAISLLETLDEKSVSIPIQIFATDLNAHSIEKARTGIYLETALANVSPQRLSRFFHKIDGSYQISKSIRNMCVFAVHDLTRDPPFSQLDLVSCRNLLIYLEPILQKRALSAFHYGLKPEGFLTLGKSESTGASRELFAQTDKVHKIYTKKGESSPARFAFTQKTPPEPSRTRIAGTFEPAGQTREIDIEKEADTLLLTSYVPASVIISSDLEIVQFRGETSLFLQPSTGRASLNLLKMVRDELEFELRSAIFQAKKKRRPIKRDGLMIMVNGTMHTIGLEVVPMKSTSTQAPNFLILFRDTTPSTPDPSEATTGNEKQGAKNRRIADLEQEQIRAREQMKSMHEEYEAASEELQSANEEVLSSNEELQSLNEEIETSKEELESTNEELTTINDELQNRNIELKETRDYAEGIVETVREPLIVLNQDLRVRTANKSFYKAFQVTPEQTEGNLIYELGDNQWDIPSLRELLSEILPKNNVFAGFEVTHNFPSIGQKVMLLNARRLVQQDSGKALILLAIEDITEEKEAQQEQQELMSIIAQRDALVKLNKTKDEFITLASHQLRTPATIVKQYIALLMGKLAGPVTADQTKYLQRAYDSNERQLKIINDLLKTAQIDSKQYKLHKRSHNIVQLIHESIADLQTIFDQNKQTVVFMGQKQSIQVLMDAIEMKLVFMNLLENASKYSYPGTEIIVSIQRKGGYVEASVADKGIGISKENQQRIFDKFTRVDNELSDTVTGTGLGLYWVKQIVELHQGSVKLVKALGKGSKFTVRLPLWVKLYS
jgi:two-component system CheB/CheR fusion protein